MLSLLVLLALALAWFMDLVRARALAQAAESVDGLLAPAALGRALQRAAGPERSSEPEALRDVAQLRNFLGSSGVLALFDAPWLPLHLLVIALMHPLLGVAATGGAIGLVLLGVLTERLTRERAHTLQQRHRATSRRSHSLLRHAEVIAGMGMAAAAVAGWSRQHQSARDAQAQLARRSTLLAATARIARQGLQVALLAIGAWLVVGADASAGIMVAATILLGRALMPVEQLIGGWKALLDARAAWQRIEQRDGKPAAAASVAPMSLPAPRGRLEVERLVFGAPGSGKSPLIKAVSFTLEAGQSLGIVGASAAGKTTLLRLLLGLWRPQAGVVRLDGADIALWDRDALGRHIGYLPQDAELFTGTVAENIARLGDPDAEAVVAAARAAHAHEMILRLPQGYDTPVGEAGHALSGGQRQRIALARALYGSPCLVVLDEPNSNLDAEGDMALVRTLAGLKARGATVIMVAHRPALMSQLDKLAVLKEGALALYGPAAEIGARLKAVPADAAARPAPADLRPIDATPLAAAANA